MTTTGTQTPNPPAQANTCTNTQAHAHTHTRRQPFGSSLLSVFTGLVFAAAAAGIAAGYYGWQQLQKELQAAAVERTALKHALSTLDENPRLQTLNRNLHRKIEITSGGIKTLTRTVESLAGRQQQLAAQLANTSDIIERGQKGWMLWEVRHILRMAQHRLLLDRDFATAAAGLRAADARIKDINDVRLIPLRRSIARQIQTLDRFPHPDYTGIQLELDNIMARLKDDLLAGTRRAARPAAAGSAQAAPPAQPAGFKKLLAPLQHFIVETLAKARQALRDSVNITHGEHKVALFIEQQEKQRAYDVLGNKLLGAKYSVSARDDPAFHRQLNAARAWLERHAEFTQRAALIRQLDALSKNNLTPPLPDISQPSIILTRFIGSLEDKQ